MTHAEALEAIGASPDGSVWPACGCSDDPDDPDQGGTGEPETCHGPTHPELARAGLGPVEMAEEIEGVDPSEWDWGRDGLCLCPCHGGAS